MKGIAIYESPFMGVDYVSAIKLNDAVYKFKLSPSDDAEVTLSGSHDVSSQAKCAKEDTYDFETGALIALMKMCGLEKSAKAYAEIFDDTAYGDALIERDKLKEENERLCREIEVLRDANKYLLSESAQRLRDKINLKEKCVALKAENEKLKLDCEKLQKGYLDTDMIFCGGRQNGKQYTFLVDLFKKIDQKKVDAAYKEAYNTKLPLWQKEVLNSLYGFHKESKEKTELPRTLDINGTTYRKSIQIKDFSNDQLDSLIEGSRAFTRKFDNEWYYGPPTKREEMWGEILKEGRTPIYVKREYIHDFLKECQEVGIKWSSGKMPLETMPFQMSEGYDGVYFFIMTTLDISKSKRGAKEFRHVMSWWCTACPDEVQAAIHYIRPMRWDLFKKGRRIIRVTHDNIDEFMTKCSNVLGGIMRPNLKRYKEFTHLFIMISDYHYDNKPTVHIMTPEDLVRNQYENSKKYSYKKIVNWEDVR